MNQTLIGYTGFVGGHLHRQIEFSSTYNSANISEIRGKEFDIVYCAGAPGRKWWANQHPEEDKLSIENLIGNLKEMKAKTFILISTVDVYPSPVNVDELSPLDMSQQHPYGVNRYQLEKFVIETYPNFLVVRLPGLFGQGLKKNVIFDFLHHNQLENIHANSCFQFYNLERLSQDIQAALAGDLALVNLATEPVSVREVAQHCFDRDFQNTQATEVTYDVHTQYSEVFGGEGNYILNKQQVLAELRQFVEKEQDESNPIIQ